MTSDQGSYTSKAAEFRNFSMIFPSIFLHCSERQMHAGRKKPLFSVTCTNKAYRPNAHLLDIVMHYYYIILHYYYNHLKKL